VAETPQLSREKGGESIGREVGREEGLEGARQEWSKKKIWGEGENLGRPSEKKKKGSL